MPGKNTTDVMFALRMLVEKYGDGQKVFEDLEKGCGWQKRRCGIV